MGWIVPSLKALRWLVKQWQWCRLGDWQAASVHCWLVYPGAQAFSVAGWLVCLADRYRMVMNAMDSHISRCCRPRCHNHLFLNLQTNTQYSYCIWITRAIHLTALSVASIVASQKSRVLSCESFLTVLSPGNLLLFGVLIYNYSLLFGVLSLGRLCCFALLADDLCGC